MFEGCVLLLLFVLFDSFISYIIIIVIIVITVDITVLLHCCLLLSSYTIRSLSCLGFVRVCVAAGRWGNMSRSRFAARLFLVLLKSRTSWARYPLRTSPHGVCELAYLTLPCYAPPPPWFVGA